MLLRDVGRADADPPPPVLRHGRLGGGVDQRRAASAAAASRTVMLRRDRPEREDAVGLPVAGDQGHAAVDRVAVARRPASKRRSSISLWPWPAEAGEPDDLARWATSSRRRLPLGPRPTRRRPLLPARVAGGPRAAVGLGDVAHRRHQAVARELGGGPVGRRPARRASPPRGRRRRGSRRAGARSARSCRPRPTNRRTIGQELVGHDRVERGGRLVQDDQPDRRRRWP